MNFVFDWIKETKGAISEREMDAFTRASAGMRNSKAGNDLILNIGIRVEERKQELVKQQRDYMRKNKTLEGFDKQWNDYIEKNSIIDANKLKQFEPVNEQKTPEN